VKGQGRQTRWRLLEEAQTELPRSLLLILVVWPTLLFVSFGLFAISAAIFSTHLVGEPRRV
jgi:hypothetical protein